METAIFRVVQECLANIHRRSGSAIAKVRVSRSDTDLRVEVQDQGKGDIASETVGNGTGWQGGIRGMRERIRQLGGGLEIGPQRVGGGMTVVARMPIAGSSWSRPSKERQYRRYGWMSRDAIETTCSPNRRSGATRAWLNDPVFNKRK